MKKILVVDDEKESREMVASVLEQLVAGDFEIRQAKNGLEALNVLRLGFIPDLIITDYRMPEMNGIEFNRSVKKEFGEIPAILITGDFTKAEVEVAKTEFSFCLAKPFNNLKLAENSKILLKEG